MMLSNLPWWGGLVGRQGRVMNMEKKWSCARRMEGERPRELSGIGDGRLARALGRFDKLTTGRLRTSRLALLPENGRAERVFIFHPGWAMV